MAFSGDRHFNDAKVVEMVMGLLDKDTIVLVGDCTGLDSLVRTYCKKNNIAYKVFEADWEKYGRAAGPIRNKAMLLEADALIAFHYDIAKSRGTKDAIRQATKLKIPYYLVDKK